MASASFSIRKADDGDSTGILECLQLAFAPYREQYTPEGFLDTVLTPETLLARKREMTAFVAVTSAGQVIGTIACARAAGCEGHLRGMAVRPEWQGSGVSTRLLEQALEELRQAGCMIVTLDTTEPLHKAVRFYEKNGFRASGKVRDFFGMPLIEYSRRL